MITERATFAGGCFWCLQHEFDAVPGVLRTTVGYTGGEFLEPRYEEVCSGKTGHVEALEVSFNPEKISFQNLLDIYWHSIDPTRSDGQFSDIGSQYRPIIFYHNAEQKRIAEFSKEMLLSQGIPVQIAIRPATPFYPAEDYHQKYYQKFPKKYNTYAHGSGRATRLRELWKEKS